MFVNSVPEYEVRCFPNDARPLVHIEFILAR
jgi:hypothetical protein